MKSLSLRGIWERNGNWIITGAAAVGLLTGVALSHRMEPGVGVEKVTLAEDTPALKFIPTGAGPHPVALLAHGYAGSKETLFRLGEALAAAGFVCFFHKGPKYVVRVTFIKNDQGEVTAILLHLAGLGLPDSQGKKMA